MRSPSFFLHALELVKQLGPLDARFFPRLQSVWAVESCTGRLRGATELSFGALLSDVRYVRAWRNVKVAYSADAIQPILQRRKGRGLRK